MTTPEPSPLSEQELKTLEEYTQSLVCCVCDGPDADGDHDDDCQAPFWQTVSRAIAQARAARPSPWQKVTRVEVIAERGRVFTRWDCHLEHTDSMFQDDGRTLKLFVKGGTPTSPPAQDRGRP